MPDIEAIVIASRSIRILSTHRAVAVAIRKLVACRAWRAGRRCEPARERKANAIDKIRPMTVILEKVGDGEAGWRVLLMAY